MFTGGRFATTHFRRSLAAASLVLATGGLVLFRAPPVAAVSPPPLLADALNGANFNGPGMHGSIALSHRRVLSGSTQDVYAQVRVAADRSDVAQARAPLALAVVLDTSGSMEGEKIEQAKDSVIKLVTEMRDEDEIAVVRYSDEATVVQRLARLREVRTTLIARIRAISAGGGTAIPSGLSAGIAALAQSGSRRVQRIVLVSDGLDSTRPTAEALARASFDKGITISSLGVGLDFDEAYMSSLARAGHGNFGFVKDASALASFLRRELDEAAATSVENAVVHLQLPQGLRFESASGADARLIGDGTLELKFGSLFAGDERRALVHLRAQISDASSAALSGDANWTRVSGGDERARFSAISLQSTSDPTSVEASIDRAVMADAVSVIASARELEATEAYARGDSARASALIEQNLGDLRRAATLAPAPAVRALAKQLESYGAQRRDFAAAPGSAEGQVAAKRGYEVDSSNMSRSAF